MEDTPNRRDSVTSLATAAAGAALTTQAACQGSSGGGAAGPAVHTSGKRYSWSMVTTWPPHFPILGESADKIAAWIGEMSGGRLTIKVYGGGELVPPLEAFDNVRQGNVEMGHGASYYWAGKVPAAQFFASVPFGMNAQQLRAWMLGGDGLKLWEELYADFGLVPMPVGNTGVQMAGWFNKEIGSVADLKGLKMRIPGLGGKVISEVGAAAVLSPGSEIYTNLERGVIDATEWVGPFHDQLMGFHKIAKYYYYPGWHEPGTELEMFIHKPAWDLLDAELQAIVRAAAQRSAHWVQAELDAKNTLALNTLTTQHGVKVLPLPADVLATLRTTTVGVLDGLAAGDPAIKKVYDSYQAFRKTITRWTAISELAYHKALG
ncbi:MAG: TRAP transporter substrate-binding protein [Myxococcota bacterium]